jgi:hypothetical protein
MMALDSMNNLGVYPLPGLDKFIFECEKHKVKDVNFTGSNTDPALYQFLGILARRIRDDLPDVSIGVRTNGVLLLPKSLDITRVSLSVPSLKPEIYKRITGSDSPPVVEAWLDEWGYPSIKVNIVLTPLNKYECLETITMLAAMGIRRINLREPYGQPHVGNPLEKVRWMVPHGKVHGMPRYQYGLCSVVYWDVHHVHVESVNLYANGVVSDTYAVTVGHDPEGGMVASQKAFPTAGRQHRQWEYFPVKEDASEH